jgi:hypothetical protein
MDADIFTVEFDLNSMLTIDDWSKENEVQMRCRAKYFVVDWMFYVSAVEYLDRDRWIPFVLPPPIRDQLYEFAAKWLKEEERDRYWRRIEDEITRADRRELMGLEKAS